MPKVPSYESQNITQSPIGAIQTAKAKPETFGGGDASIAKAANEVASLGVKVYEEQRKKAAQIEAQDADAQLTKIETDLLYNEKYGALNSKGRNAFDIGEKTVTSYQEAANNISAGLKTPEAREMFKGRAIERGLNIDRSLQRHMSQEGIRYDADATDAAIKNEQDAAIKNYKDLNRIDLSMKNQESAIVNFGQRNGLPQEKVNQMLSDSRSKTHSTIIGRHIDDGNDGTAQQYFKKFEGQITDGPQLEQVRKMLDISSTRSFAVDFADKYQNEDPKKVKEYLSSIGDDKKRMAAEDRYFQQQGINKKLQKQASEDLYQGLYDQISTEPDMFKLDAELMTKLDDGEQRQLLSHQKDMLFGNGQTNEVKYNDVMDLASNPKTRSAFIELDVRKTYGNDIKGDKLQKVLELQRKIKFGDGKAASDLDNISVKTATLKDEFRIAGFNAENKKDFAEYTSYVEKQVAAAQQVKNGKLSDIEEKEIAKSALLSVRRKGSLWGTNSKPLFKQDDAEAVDIAESSYADIPRVQKVKIENYLKSKGGAVNQTAVVQFYRAQLLKGLRSGK